MWKKAGLLLIILSVALNLAFIGTWVTHTIRTHWVYIGPGGYAVGPGGMWCPLHRSLGVTQDQWRRVEPRLAEFRESSQALGQDVERMRGELIDLLALPQAEPAAIAAKQEEILNGQKRMQDLVVRQLLAEKEVLTPDQQKALFDMLLRRGGCGGHGMPMQGPESGRQAPGARGCPGMGR